ncbi:restriction endonuclease subunit S [Pediococcus pentosaceus]|uniref:restriction endonuclease subunit S n=1 Tax=Pediococcus pentosaceus TaxID=1255 RepID=UPI0035D01966
MGEVSKIVGGGTPSTKVNEYWNGKINWYTPAEIGQAVYVDKSKKKITEAGLKKSSAKLLPQGTILFTSRAGIGKTAILLNEASTNQGFQSIVPSKNLDTYFIFSKTPDLKKYGEITGSGSTFVEVSGKQMEQMKIWIPVLDEQQAIGSLFKKLDDLIALQQRKIDTLKLLKRALLQQMFPEKGKDIPRVRFTNYTSYWTEQKLGNMGNTQSGIGFPSIEQGYNSGVPFFKVSDLNNIGNEQIMSNSNNYVTGKQIKHKNWKTIKILPAVIFAKIGAAIFLNRKRLVFDEFLIDNNLMCYSFDRNKWDINFGKIIFDKLYLPKYSQVGALPSLNSKDINHINIKIPLLDEQRCIGFLLNNLNCYVMFVTRESKNLKSLKKALLQKMFI